MSQQTTSQQSQPDLASYDKIIKLALGTTYDEPVKLPEGETWQLPAGAFGDLAGPC